MPNIVLIDNHKMILESLALLIESSVGNHVVGKFRNGKDALKYVRANRNTVDVVVSDISMPTMNGLEVLSEIRKKHDKIKVVLLTQFAGEYYISKSIKLGVNAYVLKNCDGLVLLQAISTVAAGDFFLCKESNSVFINNTRKNALNESLTDREKNIIKLITIGKPSEEIALALNISKHTVAYHRKNIYDKLQIKSVPELTIYALRSGLLFFQDGMGYA